MHYVGGIADSCLSMILEVLLTALPLTARMWTHFHYKKATWYSNLISSWKIRETDDLVILVVYLAGIYILWLSKYLNH